MIQKPTTPRPRGKPSTTTTGRRRGRPPGSTNAARAARLAAVAASAASEPPPKRRRYIPGGAGGGGRFVEVDALPDGGAGDATPSVRASVPRRSASASVAASVARRVTRNPRRRREEVEESEEYGSAAAVAAAVAQSEGYKPREERGWEEFHPDLDIEATFKVFSAAEVDGTLPTPAALSVKSGPTELPATPPKRRVGRPPRDLSYGVAASFRTPVVLPIHNQTPKERLDLKRPSYRRMDRVSLFESKALGTARYVEKAMANVGFQETDRFDRADNALIKASDSGWDDDHHDHLLAGSALGEKGLGRVEYDMDEQDDMWLEALNRERKTGGHDPVTRELFEITITKIEKEWHALEKRIPKPNPKPPQTQRPRSSSAAAVNGEQAVAHTSGGDEPDSKCAICDDGDCENTNAIVFCDGCDLAVHQECYGVPFIPEGQWLCRKCQLIGRGIPTCIFCPNTDGAFKQTNSSKWSHLLCAMWIPEVSLGNHTFMEPVMEVEKVPKTRWKLSCYICKQRMGACIQCSNKNCYQAFHVTCARRARLFLKMKTSQGVLAVLDGGMTLKAFCDRHCPSDYTEDNKVAEATRAAKRFYRKKMKGRVWADSQGTAALLAAQQSVACEKKAAAEASPAPTVPSGCVTPVLGGATSGVAPVSGSGNDKKKGIVWKLPSGAPVIPAAVFDSVDVALSRFSLRKRREFVAEVCRYWTLKREARRGAALLKRLQLQMETFSSMELTRRNFTAMPSGKQRLQRRIEFAEVLLRDLKMLQDLAFTVVDRETVKLEGVKVEEEFVDTCYFPVVRSIIPAIDKAIDLDKNVFATGFDELRKQLYARLYTTTIDFAKAFATVLKNGINSENGALARPRAEGLGPSPTKQNFSDIRARKTLGKRIARAIYPFFEAAIATEATVLHKSVEELAVELEAVLQSAWDAPAEAVSTMDVPIVEGEDHVMADAPPLGQTETPDAETDETQLGGVARTITVATEKPLSQTTPPQTTECTLPPPSTSGGTNEDASSHDEAAAAPDVSVATNQTPPTPPQSNINVSFSKSSTGSPNALKDGGSLWYLTDFHIHGLSAMSQEWDGREAVRGLSEELTDIDDDELKGLEAASQERQSEMLQVPGRVSGRGEGTFVDSGQDVEMTDAPVADESNGNADSVGLASTRDDIDRSVEPEAESLKSSQLAAPSITVTKASPGKTSPIPSLGTAPANSPRRSSPRKVSPLPSPSPALGPVVESALPHHPAPQSVLSDLSDVSSLLDIDGDVADDRIEEEEDVAAVDSSGAQSPGTSAKAANGETNEVMAEARVEEPRVVKKEEVPVVRATRANAAAAAAAAAAAEKNREPIKKRTRSSTRSRR